MAHSTLIHIKHFVWIEIVFFSALVRSCPSFISFGQKSFPNDSYIKLARVCVDRVQYDLIDSFALKMSTSNFNYACVKSKNGIVYVCLSVCNCYSLYVWTLKIVSRIFLKTKTVSYIFIATIFAKTLVLLFNWNKTDVTRKIHEKKM